jgi:hypothetical protein
MHLGQFGWISVPAVLEPVPDVAGHTGHIGHHQDLADSQYTERAENAVHHVAFLRVLKNRCLGDKAPHVPTRSRINKNTYRWIQLSHEFHIRQ